MYCSIVVITIAVIVVEPIEDDVKDESVRTSLIPTVTTTEIEVRSHETTSVVIKY